MLIELPARPIFDRRRNSRTSNFDIYARKSFSQISTTFYLQVNIDYYLINSYRAVPVPTGASGGPLKNTTAVGIPVVRFPNTSPVLRTHASQSCRQPS